MFNYAFHILPQSWQMHFEICFDDSFWRFGAKIFANNASQKKKIHLTGIHHHPMKSHQRQPRCLVLSCVSVTACTLTFSLPHLGHFIMPFLSSTYILRPHLYARMSVAITIMFQHLCSQLEFKIYT